MVVTAGNASDGGEGNSGAPPIPITSRVPSDGEKFPRAVATVAVAQICNSAGFHSIQRSALDILADIAIRYLCDVGKVSQLYANLSNRTESNALDAVAALEDISGASCSEPHGLASSSVSVKELMRFVEYGDELPFAKPLPHFPASKTRKLAPSFTQIDETPPNPHIPSWLPVFPDPQTYTNTSVENEDKRHAHVENFEETRQKQKAEQSRVALRFRLCTSGASTSGDHSAPHNVNHTASMGTSPPSASRSTVSDHQELGKTDSEGVHNKAKSGKRPSTGTQNPFLAPALPEGSKEVSTWFFDDFRPPSPAPSTKKIIAPPLPSMRGAFRPILEAANSYVHESSRSLSGGALLAMKDHRQPVRRWMMMIWMRRSSEHKKGSHSILAWMRMTTVMQDENNFGPSG
ncbi:hypothetical protein GOP47_0005233 [Adiantum capillus-veneris]|uniref:Transcription initiation factor TFIID subunit 8 n=1 Tax=Adiantum capillus-veneris TaxID=13818 RepID=A0A9D4V4R9_ADICA|nr:hypothetical protein GOP47_0005233 [Adiantum capillus-veneris]